MDLSVTLQAASDHRNTGLYNHTPLLKMEAVTLSFRPMYTEPKQLQGLVTSDLCNHMGMKNFS